MAGLEAAADALGLNGEGAVSAVSGSITGAVNLKPGAVLIPDCAAAEEGLLTGALKPVGVAGAVLFAIAAICFLSA